MRKLKQRFERQEQTLAKLEEQKEAIAVAVLRQRDEIAAARDQLASTQGELRSSATAARSTLAQVRASRSELEGDLQELEAAQARVTGQLQGSLPAGPIKHGTGQLIWPVNGPVVSPFGMRWGRLHAGIDIAVPAGTPIRAADGGTVVLLGEVSRLRQLHLRPAHRLAVDLLRPPVGLRDLAGRLGDAGPGDRLRRLHRPLLRRPPPLRDAPQRVASRSVRLPLGR